MKTKTLKIIKDTLSGGISTLLAIICTRAFNDSLIAITLLCSSFIFLRSLSVYGNKKITWQLGCIFLTNVILALVIYLL